MDLGITGIPEGKRFLTGEEIPSFKGRLCGLSSRLTPHFQRRELKFGEAKEFSTDSTPKWGAEVRARVGLVSKPQHSSLHRTIYDVI